MENQERKKIRVRIVKSTSQKLWYRDRIGDEIEVFADSYTQDGRSLQGDWDGEWFELADRPQYFARVDDCEIIPEESKPAGPIGREEGDVCNRNGCPGKIVIVYDPERSCTCHINPPCSRCMDVDLKCDQCGAEPMEEEVRETLAIPEEAPADHPEGMIPFKMHGYLNEFEAAYLEPISLLSVDNPEVCRNLLSAIWEFANNEWERGKEFGEVTMKEHPAGEFAQMKEQVRKLEEEVAGERKIAAAAEMEMKSQRTTMIAAAEYLSENYQKLADEDGAGPQNLVLRLEGRLSDFYPGYTAGAFQRMQEYISHLEKESQEARAYAVALKEEVAVAEREAEAAKESGRAILEKLHAATLRFHMVNGADEFHAISKFMDDVSGILCGRSMTRKEWTDRAILEQVLGSNLLSLNEWERRGRKAEAMMEASLKDCKAWEVRAETAETRLKHADSMLEFFRRKNMKIRRQILQALLQARDSLNDSIPEGEMNAMNVFQLLNVVREHLGKLGWIANLPTTEENLQPVSEATIPEALIGFVAWMTARPQAVVMGGAYDATAPLECVHHYMKVQGFDTAAPVTFDQIKPMKDFPVDIESPYFIAPWDVQRNEEGGVNIKAPKPLAPGCSNDVPIRTKYVPSPSACEPCQPAGSIDRIEFRKGEVFIAEAISDAGESLWGAAADTLEELLEGMTDEHRVRITKETAEAELKEWARQQSKPSPEKVWREFQMKGPGGNPAKTDAAPETWRQSFRRWWRSLAYGINDNGPSDQ